MSRVVILLCACAMVAADFDFRQANSRNHIRDDLHEDAQLKVPGLVQKYGYPLEEHQVVTSDGYILTMHRIPHGMDCHKKSKTDRPVVFLMHGILSSSADWVVMGPSKGLAYILAEEGFDVWLGNARGNLYSRAHLDLYPDGYNTGFWQFSWDEIGNIDLPTMIDYTLEEAGKKRLHYIGHSQGTTAFFVMCSLRADYNQKIISMNALGPVAYMSNSGCLLIRVIARFTNILGPELVRKYGYPLEEHSVVTSDGYNLTMHRIPYGKSDSPGPSTKRPVAFVMHGLLSSSADWVITGPGKGLAYILADKGFDVWLGNARGNRYSRAHVSKNPESSEFWNFSWDEIGNFDLPAMIDYVLNKTSNERLHYIGHSQGTTVFFVMCSLRPAYNLKIQSMHALAPSVYFKHSRSLLLRALAKVSSSLLVLLGPDEFLPNTQIIRWAGGVLCQERRVTLAICTNIMFLIGGYNAFQMNETMIPVYLGHTPAGSSSRQLAHYAQIMYSEEFRRYDHGLLQNQKVYGTLTPPLYDLSQVRAPVYLHYSLSDPFAHVKDVERLWGKISNPVEKIIVPMSSFSHLDYMWGIDAKTLVYDKVIDIMKTLGE